MKAERKFVAADPEKCTGCSICELICSLEKEKVFSPHYSRIKAVRLHGILNVVIACRFCEDAKCVKACPREALTQSEETGIISVDNEKCNACGWCIEACDYGAITVHPDETTVLICDLCNGEPKCIEWCPEEALSLVTEEELNKIMQAATLRKVLS